MTILHYRDLRLWKTHVIPVPESLRVMSVNEECKNRLWLSSNQMVNCCVRNLSVLLWVQVLLVVPYSAAFWRLGHSYSRLRWALSPGLECPRGTWMVGSSSVVILTKELCPDFSNQNLHSNSLQILYKIKTIEGKRKSSEIGLLGWEFLCLLTASPANSRQHCVSPEH